MKAVWEQVSCLQCGTTFSVRPAHFKRGNCKFCSISCGITWRNLHKNPSHDPAVRAKISANHADVSGSNNPMYGRSGKDAPSWIDGRNSISGNTWRGIALVQKPPVCEICDQPATGRRLHVHHKDRDHKNSELDNLTVVCAKCHNNVLHPRERNQLGRFL